MRLLLTLAIAACCILPAAPETSSIGKPVSDHCAEVASPSLQENIDWMTRGNCGHPAQEPCRSETYPFKSPCPSSLMIPPLSRWINRADRSANEMVAWAIRAALAGNKEGAVAFLAATQCHNDGARREIEGHKCAAYNFLIQNYVAAWKHDNPDEFRGAGQAFRVGRTYRSDDLKDCVGDEEITSIQVPPGLVMHACWHANGGGPCRDFHAGTVVLDNAWNDKIRYVQVGRE